MSSVIDTSNSNSSSSTSSSSNSSSLKGKTVSIAHEGWLRKYGDYLGDWRKLYAVLLKPVALSVRGGGGGTTNDKSNGNGNGNSKIKKNKPVVRYVSYLCLYRCESDKTSQEESARVMLKLGPNSKLMVDNQTWSNTGEEKDKPTLKALHARGKLHMLPHNVYPFDVDGEPEPDAPSSFSAFREHEHEHEHEKEMEKEKGREREEERERKSKIDLATSKSNPVQSNPGSAGLFTTPTLLEFQLQHAKPRPRPSSRSRSRSSQNHNQNQVNRNMLSLAANSQHDAEVWLEKIQEVISACEKLEAEAHERSNARTEKKVNFAQGDHEGQVEQVIGQDQQGLLSSSETCEQQGPTRMSSDNAMDRDILDFSEGDAGDIVPPPTTLLAKLELVQKASWRTECVYQGIRIKSERSLAKENPCLRAGIEIKAPPSTVLKVFVSQDPEVWGDLFESIHKVEVLSKRSHITHMRVPRMWVSGIPVAPREFTQQTFWRQEDDGSFLVMSQSITHEKAPPTPGYVQAQLYGLGVSILPLKTHASVTGSHESPSTYVQYAIHASPGGWIAKLPQACGVAKEYTAAFVKQLLNVRDHCEALMYVDPMASLNAMHSYSQQPPEHASASPTSDLAQGSSRDESSSIGAKHSKEDSIDEAPDSTAASKLSQTYSFGNAMKSIAPSLSRAMSSMKLQVLPNLEGDDEGDETDQNVDHDQDHSQGDDNDNEPPQDQNNRPSADASGGADTINKMKKPRKITGSLSKQYWRNPTEPFNLRGKTYLKDKVKVPSRPLFDLEAVDLWEVDEPLIHVASEPNGIVEKLQKKYKDHFIFVVSFRVPGPPFYNFALYFTASREKLDSAPEFSGLFQDFIEGSEDFQDSRFKLIPRVVNGPFPVKLAVGDTPAILGRKLKQYYYKGERYFELDVDIGSSSVAGGVLRVVKGYATGLTIDLAFTLEGHLEDELPEQVLGAVQIDKVDLTKAKKKKTQASS